MEKRTIRDLDVTGARVLLRTDYNVEVEGDSVLDDIRLVASLPTLRELRAAGARTAICSHRGRPKGTAREALSNRPLAAHLSQLLGAPVETASDCVGGAVEAAIEGLEPGGVLLLENVRFHPGEESNDPDFARELARLGDVYVNDAFGALHRAHASIVGVPRYLPSAAGLLVEREVEALETVAVNPERPSALVLGGVKAEDKLPMVEHLLPQLDVLCLGGLVGMAVLRAAGLEMPGVTVDAATSERAKRLIEQVRLRPEFRLVLPCTVTATDGLRTLAMSPVQLTEAWQVVDMGAVTVAAFQEALIGCRTIIWNGPMGVFERSPFDSATNEIASFLAELPSRTVVAGGETSAAVRRCGVAESFTHVSTGGGAALQLLSGQRLPGLDALPDRDSSMRLSRASDQPHE